MMLCREMPTHEEMWLQPQPPLQQRCMHLDEHDFLELQQLCYPLDQLDHLMAYTPATPEDLGLSVATLTERVHECSALAEAHYAADYHSKSPLLDTLFQPLTPVPAEHPLPMAERSDSLDSSTPSTPIGDDHPSTSDLSEGSDRSLPQASGSTLPNASRQRKMAWTNVEDRIIEEGVAAFGHKWSKIADLLPHERTDDAVRNRWQRLRRRQQRRVLLLQREISEEERGKPLADLPLVNAGGANFSLQLAMPSAPANAMVEEQGKHGDMWTPEEDQIIDHAVRIQGLRWRAIATMLPGRTDSGCRNRWVRSQERQLAAEGVPVHGAAEVFAALRAAGKLPGLNMPMSMAAAA